ncbi:hypothetical protein N9164_10350 [Draconibacterium sp.]|nr:hypothetical protein [Draconibacterium sp.]
MRTIRTFQIFLLAIILFCITNCEDLERNNPFDEKCPKEIFSPYNLKAEQQGNVIELNWEQTNTQISGFIISRNNNNRLMTEVARVEKTITSWSDNKLIGGVKYGYQLVAYAGENQSNAQEVYLTPFFISSIHTKAPLNITSTSVVLGGNIASDGGATVTDRGICFSTTKNPTTSDEKVSMGNGTGSFSNTISGLSTSTVYYARAYAINSQGTAYGSQVSFTTLTPQAPIALTLAASNITSTTATLNAEVNANGQNTTVTFEYGTTRSYGSEVTASQSPISGSAKIHVSAIISGLTENITYYFRVKAVNAVGRSFGESKTFYASHEGLIAYYPFNGNANDESGNGNNGTIYGSELTTDRFGNENSAYSFDGQNDFIKASASKLPIADRTISVWFYANSVENRPGLLGYGGGGGGTSWFMGLNIHGGKSYHMSCHYGRNAINYYYTAPPVNLWFHWVITIDKQGTKIYINGAEKKSNSTFISNTYVSGTELGIGVIANTYGRVPYTDSNVKYFNGIIDDIRIYNRALSKEEIQVLYHEKDWSK